jgi:hypothetical protein
VCWENREFVLLERTHGFTGPRNQMEMQVTLKSNEEKQFLDIPKMSCKEQQSQVMYPIIVLYNAYMYTYVHMYSTRTAYRINKLQYNPLSLLTSDIIGDEIFKFKQILNLD